MSFTQISAAIVTTLQDLEIDGHPAFKDVKDHGTDEFEGLPAAIVIESDNPADYSDVATNRREYVYHIWSLIPIGGRGLDAAMRDLRVLTDLVLDTFDQSGGLGGLVPHLKPATAEWGSMQSENGPAVYSKTVLRAEKDVDTGYLGA